MSSVTKTRKPDVAVVVLRLGLAFVFAYAAISALRTPQAWIGFVPHVITHFVSANTFLKINAVVQFILAGLLVIGKFLKPVVALSALLLIGIVVFNLSSLLITFRDIGLACMAIALFLLV